MDFILFSIQIYYSFFSSFLFVQKFYWNGLENIKAWFIRFAMVYTVYAI